MKTDFLIAPDIFTCTNPVTGETDFQLHFITEKCGEDSHISNFFFIVFLKKGRGKIIYDMGEYSFSGPSLMFFSPFHPYKLIAEEDPEGLILQFTTGFYWFQQDRSPDKSLCGVFKREKGSPIIPLNNQDVCIVGNLVQSVIREFEWFEEPNRNMICNYIKSILIHSLRIQSNFNKSNIDGNGHFPQDYQLLKDLNCLIQKNFKNTKRPADYAELLHITPSGLTKATRKHYGKTVTDLIQQRVLEEARKELSVSGKSIKEIAIDLGYNDPYYFSRLFKKISGMSPEAYRQQVFRFLNS